MANTFTKVYIQIVFVVKGRENLISKDWRSKLHKYISGIITAKSHKSIIVNGVGDHVHCFIGLNPNMSISDLARDIKNNSSKFINENKFVKGKFQWQHGYGAFSYSETAVKNVYNNVLNQEEHHKERDFKREFIDLLERYEIEYKPEYLFDFLD
jgi:REP element-mobilizing transposase RayT